MTIFVGKYYNAKKIESAREITRKTSKGKPVYEILLEGVIEEVPLQELEKCATDQMVDASMFRINRIEKVSFEILEALLESEIPLSWIDVCFQRVKLSIDRSMERAAKLVYGKEVDQLTLKNLDDILKNERKQDNRDNPIKPARKKSDNVNKEKIPVR